MPHKRRFTDQEEILAHVALLSVVGAPLPGRHRGRAPDRPSGRGPAAVGADQGPAPPDPGPEGVRPMMSGPGGTREHAIAAMLGRRLPFALSFHGLGHEKAAATAPPARRTRDLRPAPRRADRPRLPAGDRRGALVGGTGRRRRRQRPRRDHVRRRAGRHAAHGRRASARPRGDRDRVPGPWAVRPGSSGPATGATYRSRRRGPRDLDVAADRRALPPPRRPAHAPPTTSSTSCVAAAPNSRRSSAGR